MRVLVTGGSGFAMSVLARALATDDAVSHLVLHDQAQPHELVVDQASTSGITLIPVVGDIRDRRLLHACVDDYGVDTIIHAAALTHVPAWEHARPADYFDVNVMGTVSLLEAARRSRSPIRQLVLISSCAVYGSGQPGLDPQPEDGPTLPDDIYGITKLAAESALRRYGELFDIPYVIARPGKLFGPMEHPTSARAVMSAPYELAAAWLRGELLRVTERTMDAALDWLNAEDAASALHALARGKGRNRATYNIGTGRRIPFREVVAAAEHTAGQQLVEVVSDSSTAELDLDPNHRLGKDAASDIARTTTDLGWSPRPFQEQISSYMRHLSAYVASQ